MTDDIKDTVAEVAAELRAANTEVGRAASQASAVMGIYGISGTGKSNLADTAAEFCMEEYGKISLVYAADLGGFGTKRLSLIRRGIMRVYDPRNHVNPFETMELISLGAFPITLTDPETGYAEPDVQLILPRKFVYQIYCPQGHAAERFDSQAVMNAKSAAAMIKCPTCGVVTTLSNAAKVERLIVRHRLFKDVGMRVYDSFTALNDWGMQDLQEQSAKGTLPASAKGGSLLGAADALVSGQFTFGSSSEGQYGFLQNRTYGWLSNIKKVPDQVLPAIATFHVETSKEPKRGGGDLHYGPKIAGNARTSTVPGWLGHLLHATVEPYSDTDHTMVYRLWLRNHIDPRDSSRMTYVAKQRGTPLDVPYLEDKPGEKPWTGFSLAVFYRMQAEQLAKLDAENLKRFPNAPGMWTGDVVSAEADEVVGGGAVGVGVARQPVASVTAAGGGSHAPSPAPTPASGGAGVRRRAGGSQIASPISPVAAVKAPEPVAAAPPPPATVAEAAAVVFTAVTAVTAPAAAAPPATTATSRAPLRRVARPPV